MYISNFFIHFIIIFQTIKFISVSLDSGQHSTHIPCHGKRGIEIEETEQEGEKSKNRTNRQQKKGTGSKEPENEGKKVKN